VRALSAEEIDFVAGGAAQSPISSLPGLTLSNFLNNDNILVNVAVDSPNSLQVAAGPNNLSLTIPSSLAASLIPA
jgi:hypothetical protein